MVLLNANDVFELAMTLERSGEAFYRAVARKATDTDLTALFNHLAEQETQHYATFQRFAKEVWDRPVFTPEEWEEYRDYLQATIQHAFFEGPDKALAQAEKVADPLDALHMAMAFEKDTLLFFYDLRDLLPESGRPHLDRVIGEEKTHLRQLAEQASRLSDR